jgi:prepilin-type N-terminal cleavage/methylation domain-containing protein
MIKHAKANRTQTGFSLVEMAIVLTIVALLLGSLLPTISSQIDQQRRTETRKQLDDIQQALMGYAIINGRLPCPATTTIPTGQTNAGIALTTGSNCTYASGVLPWATLGVSETDAWGWRFTYMPSASFTSTSTPFSLASTGLLTVKSSVGGTSIASSIPAVIVSHGKNGAGAYTTKGTQLPQSSNTDEVENSNGDTTFVSHDFTTTFDDLIVWISPNILFNRMVAASKLP